MDLTPPSLTTSPASPELEFRQSPASIPDDYQGLETAAANYPSPTFLDFAYRPVTPYGSLDAPSISEGIETLNSISSFDSMSQEPWGIPESTKATQATVHPSSTIPAPNMLSSHYDPFASFEPCLPPTHYGSPEAYPHPATSAGLARPHAGSVDPASGRVSFPVASRASFSYAHDPMASRIKQGGASNYSPSLEAVDYSSSAPIPGVYNPQPYPSDGGIASWPKQEFEGSPVFTTPQTAPSPALSHASDRTTHSGSTAGRRKRTSRKHTTREEANFQCRVEGCGKFFSRSYNFKSHMETHDDKREYPFPCPVRDCTKKFVRKTDLQRHHQSVHMKERNHKCDYCSRMFARKDTLRRHMEDGCSKRFDIETLDIRSEACGSPNSGSRAGQPVTAQGVAEPTASRPPLPMTSLAPFGEKRISSSQVFSAV